MTEAITEASSSSEPEVGQIVEAYDYDVYGNTFINTSADSEGVWWSGSELQSPYGINEFLFCGYRYEFTNRFYYARNRLYAPSIGRWCQRDKVDYQDGMNILVYTHSNPSNQIDPMGDIVILLPLAPLVVEGLVSAAAALALIAGGGIALGTSAYILKEAIEYNLSLNKLVESTRSSLEKAVNQLNKFKCPCPCVPIAVTYTNNAIRIFLPDKSWPTKGMIFTSEFQAAYYEKIKGPIKALRLMNRHRAKDQPQLTKPMDHRTDVLNSCNAIKRNIKNLHRCLRGSFKICGPVGSGIVKSAISALHIADKACNLIR